MYRNLFFILLYFLSTGISAQVLKTSLPFSTATPYVEPDGRKNVAKISESEYVILSKLKGGLSGESHYQIEKYDKDLIPKFKTPVVCPSEEDFKELFFNGTDIVLFSVLKDESQKISKLMAYGFDANTGTKKWDKVLHEQPIKEWFVSQGKGVVKTSFENEICSSLSKSFVTPTEYQYEIKHSPDKNKILVYIFDYSIKQLLAHAIVFDKTLNKVFTGSVPIDNGFINYGIFPNNKGEVYILNADRTGRIVIIQYHIQTKNNKILDIQNANTNRASFHLQVLTDDAVYIGCVNTLRNKLTGVMYAKFDFKQNIVDRINFHDISVGIQQTAQAMRSNNKFLSGEENWLNYEIVHFNVNEYEKIIMVLEKREINAIGYTYNYLSTNDPQNWTEKVGKVNTEGVVLFSFNKDDELLWENFYQKAQVNDISAGITASSFSFNITDDGRLRMFYPSYENSTGVYNLINYVEWDELTGNKTKDLKTPNEEGLSMLTDFSVWWEDRVVLVGRKGFLGKKSTMNLYKLEVN